MQSLNPSFYYHTLSFTLVRKLELAATPPPAVLTGPKGDKMGGRGRSRTQRKHFRQGRENVWKRSKSDSQQEDDNENTNAEKSKTHWEPFATQNAGFDDYYKVPFQFQNPRYIYLCIGEGATYAWCKTKKFFTINNRWIR